MDAVERIERFTGSMDFEQFSCDDKTAFAVVRSLEIIGEAAKKVPKSVRDCYPAVPWSEMAGIRDKLIHEYFGVKLEVVWKTVQEDLPALKPQITRMMAEITKGGKSKL